MKKAKISNLRHSDGAEYDAIVDRATIDENDVFQRKLNDVNSIVKTLRELDPKVVVDPNEVFELIESESEENRNPKNIVIDRLIAKRKNIPEAPAPLDVRKKNVWDKFQGLVNDVDEVEKFVRNRSREEIFAYLEANHEKPNRVRLVVSELLAETSDGASKTMEKVKSILELLPDADPEHLRVVVEECGDDADGLNATVSEWLEDGRYPKLAEVEKAAIKRKFVQSDFSVEEFLNMFPDPENYFQNDERVTTQSYKQHVQIYLGNQFRFAYKDDLTSVMRKHHYHLTPIMKELNALWNSSSTDEPSVKKSKDIMRKKKQRSALKPMPEVIDELFYKEKLFIEMEDRIKQFKKDKELERQRKIEMAKQKGELMACDCCYEDELLIEDMLHCSDAHLFCRTCIRRQAEVQIGHDKYEFPCLDAYCQNEFPLIVLQRVLPSNVFSNLVRKMQDEEIRRAHIPDLESCPHCSFCAIMPDARLKIFRCLNPECLKVTCRLCKEPNHLPLRCDEIEQRVEVQLRTHLEDGMTDALLRTCPRCKRRIIKEDGCNKMKCPCGQSFCYVCREPIRDYRHFETGECPHYSNDAELHRLEVQEGARKARREYIEAHPLAETIELKHDPTKTPVVGVRGSRQQQPHEAMPRLNKQGKIVFKQPERQ